MKHIVGTIFIIQLLLHSLVAQEAKFRTYDFITKNKDTVKAELGTFFVAENRTKINSDSIQLSFVRFKSTSPNPGSPIVYLAGGPGGSGISTARGKRFKLFMKLREVADVIALDQRGIGKSNSLSNCPYWAKISNEKAIDKSGYIKITTGSISKCTKFWTNEGIDITAYNTTENAKDIEDLRRVLKTNKISLWGLSYGSHLAFEYIRLFESNIDRVVLASLEGSDETIKLPKSTENFLFKIADLAKENYGSDVKYPNLKKKMIEVHRRARQKPITTRFQNRSGQTSTIEISNFELQMAIASFFLKNPEDSKKLPKLYSQMYEGDFSSIAPYIVGLRSYLSRGIGLMSLAMDLHSGISKERAELVKEQIDISILGSTINFLLYEWMAKTDFTQLPDDFRKMKPNNVNALLLSGTLDGRTYLSDGISIAKKFINGQHVIIENAGHDLYMQSPEVGKMVVDFFKDKSVITERLVLNPIIFD